MNHLFYVECTYHYADAPNKKRTVGREILASSHDDAITKFKSAILNTKGFILDEILAEPVSRKTFASKGGRDVLF